MNEYLYLLFQFLLLTTAAMLCERINTQILYLIPMSLAVLYLLAFFKKKLVILIYMVDLLPLLVFCHNGVELFTMFMSAGVVSMMVFEHFNKSWRQFVHALIIFAVLFLVYSGFMFMNGTHWTFRQPAMLFLGSLLCVAGYPLIYLFEKVFQLVSNSRLQELCDPNNKLLREMASKAPGTFQHSLQVMNMVDAAARSIGANVLLVRAGAMYHDIGKINNPQCFIENETIGSYYHKDLTPQQSAKEITRHVPDGVVLADRYKLPSVIKDFIITHHGTTCTGYFYNKFINAGGDPSQIDDFRYNGKIPQTKEQIILMLCDSLEAASRTLKDNKPETFDKFVEDMVASKSRDGQFEEADITLKELNILKSELKSYLSQLYHDRIAYPKRKV
jgi:putative nucleotidyltransferase with HDIG domain